ncbi:MAG TPA: hypothetical protein VFB71_00535 [Ramlibacter sp.]|nr:hypothetical protein [Ramlibacter sp.]
MTFTSRLLQLALLLLAMLAGLGELVQLQRWRLRDRLRAPR